MRTVLSLVVAWLDGRIVRDLVGLIRWESPRYTHPIALLGQCGPERIHQRPGALVCSRCSEHIYQLNGRFSCKTECSAHLFLPLSCDTSNPRYPSAFEPALRDIHTTSTSRHYQTFGIIGPLKLDWRVQISASLETISFRLGADTLPSHRYITADIASFSEALSSL
jgi:hypothetical protein